MSELNFTDYWWVYLKSNPKHDRGSDNHKELMDGHFSFIDEQIESGNLFVAIPMSPSGGQYFFDGNLSEEKMKELIEEEPSIGSVFVYELKKAHVPEHHLFFTLESHKKISEFHEKRRKMTNQ